MKEIKSAQLGSIQTLARPVCRGLLRSSIGFVFLIMIIVILVSLSGPASTQSPKKDETKFPPIKNTQNPKDRPPTPREAWEKITVPEGFQVTLYAGEPDVRQPIAMNIDDRGRLWVAESYTYTGRIWDKDHLDRILIFEDTDNDGRFDKRKVFWDQARNLSGITNGFGGVWLLCAPHLLFIPDRNGDDIPDGPPEIKLEGWITRNVGHNIVNGLIWGPDGWLYGRHGIQDNSLVGTPETPPENRTRLNCSIWRYHPAKKTFEVVCNGTTNPWGFDYDDHGQMFFTNNVIGHLWHVIPGAHYKRMYGEDFNPYLYELIDQHADHYHWDNGKPWTASRSSSGKHGELGGGHSHCGGMIYVGDNWPAKYRNTMFMCNTHGRRVNNDKLIRKGSGYVGVHQKDFLFANNPWFRGVQLITGPDGGVYISDWCDFGECHDHDGIHRTSGRIYKVTYGKVKQPAIKDVSKLSNAELVKLQLHKNDWYVRAARRILQERALAGQELKKAHEDLHSMYANHLDVTRKLRALWCLYSTAAANGEWLRKQLTHENEHVRVWAIRLLADDEVIPKETAKELINQVRMNGLGKKSGLVRLFLASSLQKMHPHQRLLLAEKLVQYEDQDDHNLPLMLWYGIEPTVTKYPERALKIARKTPIPSIRRFVARRFTEEYAPPSLQSLVREIVKEENPSNQIDYLQGMAEALRGRRKVTPPSGWNQLQKKLTQSSNKDITKLVRSLGGVFGDGRALAELRKVALDSSADGEVRRSALEELIKNRPKDLGPFLHKLVRDRATLAVAVRGLAAIGDPKTPSIIINRFRYFRGKYRSQAIDALVSRPEFAKELLQAVSANRLDRSEITAFHARQIRSFGNEKLNELLAKVWGDIRTTPAEKKALIHKFKDQLTSKRLKSADLSQGRLLFQKNCANCHRLFGVGVVVGPDLTGSNRYNLDYLLENLVDPNAVIPNDFKMSVILLKDGRVLNGVVTQKTGKTMTVQTQKEKVIVQNSDVEEIQPTKLSLMPEGQLTQMTEAQVSNLIAYLMSPRQVTLPEETKK